MPADLTGSTLKTVDTRPVTPVGVLADITLSGSMVSAYYPWAAVYAAPDPNNGGVIQLYGLPLVNANDSTPPSTAQIGNWAQPAGSFCTALHDGYANVLIPGSAFFILQAYSSTTSDCSNNVLINWNDPSGTPPTSIPSGQNYTDLYYSSGFLYAEVALTKFGGSLNIYPASNGTPSFSSPTTVTTGVSSVEHHAITVNRSGVASNTVLFENVLAGGKYYLYRIDTSGNQALVYSAAGTLYVTVFDDTSIYFIDMTTTPVVVNGQNLQYFTYAFYAAPINCGGGVSCAPVPVGAASVPDYPGGTGYTLPYGTVLSVVDSDGTNLIIGGDNLTTNPPTFTLWTLPVTGSLAWPTTPLLSYNASSSGIVAFLDYGTDHLFVNEIASTTTTTASLVLSPSSTTPLLGPTPATAFTQWAPFFAGGPTNNTVLQFQYGSTGNATLWDMNDMNSDNFMTNEVLTGSSPYMVTAGTDVSLAPVSNTVGFGTQYPSTGAIAGLVIDVSKNQIITVSGPNSNTNVAPF